jgi:hypothetical protein
VIRPALVCLLLCSCSSLKISENGQQVFSAQSDMTNVHFRTPAGTEFSADQVINSVPTLAGGQATSQIITASAGAAGTVIGGVIGLKLIPISPAAAVLGTAVPTSLQGAQGLVRPTNINVQTPSQVALQEGQIVTIQRGNTVQTFRAVRRVPTRHRRHRAHNTSPPKDE